MEVSSTKTLDNCSSFLFVNLIFGCGLGSSFFFGSLSRKSAENRIAIFLLSRKEKKYF